MLKGWRMEASARSFRHPKRSPGNSVSGQSELSFRSPRAIRPTWQARTLDAIFAVTTLRKGTVSHDASFKLGNCQKTLPRKRLRHATERRRGIDDHQIATCRPSPASSTCAQASPQGSAQPQAGSTDTRRCRSRNPTLQRKTGCIRRIGRTICGHRGPSPSPA